jgi:hypothetical protein
MKIEGVPPELLDDLIGDGSSRANLEISAQNSEDIPFTLLDASISNGADVVRELERVALTELLCGVNVDRVAGVPDNGEFRKRATGTSDEINPRTGQRWGTVGFTAQQRREYCAKFR